NTPARREVVQAWFVGLRLLRDVESTSGCNAVASGETGSNVAQGWPFNPVVLRSPLLNRSRRAEALNTERCATKLRPGAGCRSSAGRAAQPRFVSLRFSAISRA